MRKGLNFRWGMVRAAHFCLFIAVTLASAQDSKVLGEVKFQGATKVERDSGVWVDGDYVGFLKELHGDKRVMLLPGDHEISVRQSGYDDFLRKIVVEPGQVQTLRVTMHLSPRAVTPDVTATLKLNVEPGRAEGAANERQTQPSFPSCLKLHPNYHFFARFVRCGSCQRGSA